VPRAELPSFRRAVLAGCGARPEAVEPLLAYHETPYEAARLEGVAWPLADEPHLAAWEEYAAEAARTGVAEALRGRLVQMLFPVEEGISQTKTYRAATRRGVLPESPGPGPALRDPAGLSLTLHPTMAGRVPILVAAAREDFVTLVQVFSARNEPIPVPDSMGACIVTGLNNWDRVRRRREAFEAAHGGTPDEDAWLAEFARMVPQRELYQDRFILLSSGPYSAVSAADLGLEDAAWRARSVALRREHECTHYLTVRAFGRMRNNVLDELIADFVALMLVDGRYDGALALRFLGLEGYPRWREGGRLSSYLGEPPLPAPAVDVLRTLVFRAVTNLDRFCAARPGDGPAEAAPRALALSTLTLEELASDEMADRFADRLGSVPRTLGQAAAR
jgi:hypothetical protein